MALIPPKRAKEDYIILNRILLVASLTFACTPTLAKTRTITVLATAYCASCRRCGTGKYTRMDTLARRGIVAVDPHVIPLGSIVRVPGFGRLRAEDTGGAIKGKRIDICLGRHVHSLTSRFGMRKMRITYTTPRKKKK